MNMKLVVVALFAVAAAACARHNPEDPNKPEPGDKAKPEQTDDKKPADQKPADQTPAGQTPADQKPAENKSALGTWQLAIAPVEGIDLSDVTTTVIEATKITVTRTCKFGELTKSASVSAAAKVDDKNIEITEEVKDVAVIEVPGGDQPVLIDCSAELKKLKGTYEVKENKLQVTTDDQITIIGERK